MSRYRDYVFVLWGDNFEEVPATVFISELRQAGLRVKVVSLTPRRIAGSHGLALVPDLTLDEALALANQAICLILPVTSPCLQTFKNDPRIQKLIDLADKNQAQLVIGPLDDVDLLELKITLASAVINPIIYPEGDDVLKFARELADLLLKD